MAKISSEWFLTNNDPQKAVKMTPIAEQFEFWNFFGGGGGGGKVYLFWKKKKKKNWKGERKEKKIFLFLKLLS